MAHPRPRMPSAPATMAEAALPSICPKRNADVQTIFRSLRPHARARDPLSKGGAGLGRTHRIGARSGEKLAIDGIRLPDPFGGLCQRPRWAIRAGHDHALDCRGRSPGSGASRCAGQYRTIGRPIRRSRFIWRDLSKTCAVCRPTPSCCARTGSAPMTLRPIGAHPRSTIMRVSTIRSPSSASCSSPSKSRASSARRRKLSDGLDRAPF